MITVRHDLVGYRVVITVRYKSGLICIGRPMYYFIHRIIVTVKMHFFIPFLINRRCKYFETRFSLINGISKLSKIINLRSKLLYSSDV